MTVEAPTPSTLTQPDVVDLRVAPIARDPQPWPTPVGARGPHVLSDRSSLRRRRLVAGLVLASILGLVIADFLVGRVLHDQHQRHLAASFQTAVPHPQDGDPVLLIQIPSLDVNQVVVKGAGAAQLRGGPGLVDGGSIPGQRGTAVIVAHRYRYGGPFNKLHSITKGADVVVVQANKYLLHYSVTDIERVPISSRPISPKGNNLLLVTDGPGLWPSKQLVATLKPAVAPTVGRAPNAPIRLDIGSSAGGLLIALLGIGAVAAGLVVGGAWLRRRYASGTALAAILPIAGLGMVAIVLLLDLALSAAY